MSPLLTNTLNEAISKGVLPPSAQDFTHADALNKQPIGMNLLSFFGAQLAVVPLLLFIGAVSGGFLLKGAWPFIIGAICLGIAITGLRHIATQGFLSHMAFSLLLVGDGLLTYGIYKHLENPAPALAFALIVGLQLGLSALVRQAWILQLLGALACGALCVLYPDLILRPLGVLGSQDHLAFFPPLLLCAIVWLLAVLTEPNRAAGQWALTLNAVSTGWGVALVLDLMLTSRTHLRWFELWSASQQGLNPWAVANAITVMFSVLAGGALLWAWQGQLSSTTQRLLILATLCMAILTWFVPYAGLLSLVLAAALYTQRRLMVGASLVALLWLLSAFYYSLALPLLNKSQLMMGLGVLLLAGTYLIMRFGGSSNTASVEKSLEITLAATAKPMQAVGLGMKSRFMHAAPLIAISAVLAVGATTHSVWQKEQVLAHGQKIYIALAPADPRSLMQGDYMALNFELPREVRESLSKDMLNPSTSLTHSEAIPTNRRASVVATLNEKNIATVQRVAQTKETLATGELLLPVQYKNRRWVLVTDAFFFPEGQAKTFDKAKFGEVRALPNGQALLVGLLDEKLQPLTQALPLRQSSNATN